MTKYAFAFRAFVVALLTFTIVHGAPINNPALSLKGIRTRNDSQHSSSPSTHSYRSSSPYSPSSSLASPKSSLHSPTSNSGSPKPEKKVHFSPSTLSRHSTPSSSPSSSSSSIFSSASKGRNGGSGSSGHSSPGSSHGSSPSSVRSRFSSATSYEDRSPTAKNHISHCGAAAHNLATAYADQKHYQEKVASKGRTGRMAKFMNHFSSSAERKLQRANERVVEGQALVKEKHAKAAAAYGRGDITKDDYHAARTQSREQLFDHTVLPTPVQRKKGIQ